ncbi:MAG: cyclase family protein [Actinomycetota bacterium]
MRNKKHQVGAVIAVSVLIAAGGGAAATFGSWTSGSGSGRALINCPGGMSRLGHAFDEGISVFPGDPAIHISDLYTVADDFFLVEDIDTGAHAGTHLDVPVHFIEDGRSIDELAAEEFVWPAYKIDVRGETFEDNFVTVDFIRDYEREHGRIKRGSLVILQTGAEEFFGLGGDGDAYATEPSVDKDGNPVDIAANTDDLFEFENAGFSGDAVQWLFDRRHIDGVGSDAYGPDAATDVNFSATFTTLANDGVALVAIANLDSVNIRSDVIMAPTVNLTDGSGFSTDPLACHGRPRR